MKKKIFFILFISIAISSEIMDKTFKIITDKFPENISVKHDIYHLNKKVAINIQNKVRQEFFRSELNIWKIVSQDSTKYYAILDNVKGKSLPITFLAIYDNKGNVFDTEIIKYRESYGGEIKNKSWLKQFFRYNDSSNYNVGSTISGISGATISVKSVTKGLQKLSILIHQLIKDLDER